MHYALKRDHESHYILSLSLVLILVFSFTLIGLTGSVAADSDDSKVNFTILHTNDEESSLIPHTPAVDYRPGNQTNTTLGGMARLATAIKEIRSQKKRNDEDVLLFNGGDFLSGTVFGWLAPYGHTPELTLLQKLGYDAVVVGNHDYDFGATVLTEYLENADYPDSHNQTTVLASNTDAPINHKIARNDLYRNTKTYNLDGNVTVGVFGIIGEQAISVTYDTGNLTFKDQRETSRRMIDKLEKQGADIIIALSHSGVFEDRPLAMDVDGIDIIVGGHSHTALKEPIKESDTIIVQAGADTEHLGSLELSYDKETDELHIRNEETDQPYLHRIDARYTPDPEINRSVERYRVQTNNLITNLTHGEFTSMMETVALSEESIPEHPPVNETPVGNYITDAMRLVAGNVTGDRVDVAIQAGGHIRGNLTTGNQSFSKDNVSFYEITEVTGIGYGTDGEPGYPVASVYLTGKELRNTLEVAAILGEEAGNPAFLQFSGVRFKYNPRNAILFHVPFYGTPIPTSRSVTDAWLYTGNGLQPSDYEENRDRFKRLRKNDSDLYHVVIDAQILTFLPMVSEQIPGMNITPKNRDGEPVEVQNMSEIAIYEEDGTELKVWEAAVQHAVSQPRNDNGTPVIPSYYHGSSNRIIKVDTIPFIWGVYLLLGLFIVILGLIVRYYRNGNLSIWGGTRWFS